MIAFKYYHDRAKALAYLDKRLSSKNDGNGVPGEVRWFGWGADRLGLRGDLTMEDFRALLENRHPLDGRRLISAEDTKEAKKSPKLTEIIITSPRLPAREGDDGRTFSRHRSAAQASACQLEELAFGRTSFFSMSVLTGNVVAVTFDRCRFRRGLERLFTHFVLFNLTFDESEMAWRGLDSSEMESSIPGAVNHYWSELRRYSALLAMREQARRMETAEHLTAEVHQSCHGLN